MGDHLDLFIILLLVFFTIMFGVRHLDPTERHPGMMVALAAEGLFKLVAFLVTGLFICFVLYDGISDIFNQIASKAETSPQLLAIPTPPQISSWFAISLLGFFGFLFLPRQFHVAIIENANESHVSRARWLFLCYMLLINLFVLPIAAAGLLLGYQPALADTYLLRLPLDAGAIGISLLVFLGGFSAATGMIMISVMTLSTMTTNHLLLPIIEHVDKLSKGRKYLLQLRWVCVVILLMAAYSYNRLIGDSFILVNIGIISFVAVLQFAPAIIGGIFWQGGHENGAKLGLMLGFLTWLYTLLLPALAKSGWLPLEFIDEGLFGISWLRPEQLFNINLQDNLTHAISWSLLVNIGGFVLGSQTGKVSDEAQAVAHDIITELNEEKGFAQKSQLSCDIELKSKKHKLRETFCRYVSVDQAENMLLHCLNKAQIKGQ